MLSERTTLGSCMPSAQANAVDGNYPLNIARFPKRDVPRFSGQQGARPAINASIRRYTSRMLGLLAEAQTELAFRCSGT